MIIPHSLSLGHLCLTKNKKHFLYFQLVTVKLNIRHSLYVSITSKCLFSHLILYIT